MEQHDHPEVRQFDVAEIAANPLNPRQGADPKELENLTNSVREHGVLQPIVVRPHPKRPTRTPYQLVIGERRWQAAKAAGLKSIPGSVRPVDDSTCLEIMLIENGRRADLDPVEEAETYHRLHKDFGMRLEDIAARVGKSTTAVFQRVKLMDCNADVRKALAAGAVTVSVAELIGRAVHPTQQTEALERVAANRWEAAPSYREAKQIIEHEFMLRLQGVPWSLGDAKLDTKAGPCALCPKRTGTQRELFPDTKAKDVCLDRECFERKRKAAKAARLEAAAAEGSAVLEGDDARKLFDRHYQVKKSSGYVNLAAHAPLEKRGKRPKSIGEVLGKRHRPPITVVAVPGSDQLLEVARIGDVEKALKAKGVKVDKAASVSTGPSRETLERNKTRAAAAVYDAQVAAVVAGCEADVEPLALDISLLRAIARELYTAAWQDAAEATRRRRGVPSSPIIDDRPILAVIEKGTSGAVLGLLLELLAQNHRPRNWNAGDQGFLNAVAPLYTVDLKAQAAAVRDYLRKLQRQRTAKKKAPRKAKRSPAKAQRKPARKPAKEKTR